VTWLVAHSFRSKTRNTLFSFQGIEGFLVRCPCYSFQQLLGFAASVPHISIPKSDSVLFVFALCLPGSTEGTRKARTSQKVWVVIGARPNPFDSPFTTAEHPFLEVSLFSAADFAASGIWRLEPCRQFGKESVSLSEPDPEPPHALCDLTHVLREGGHNAAKPA
jgi:hypothetical protein